MMRRIVGLVEEGFGEEMEDEVDARQGAVEREARAIPGEDVIEEAEGARDGVDGDAGEGTAQNVHRISTSSRPRKLDDARMRTELEMERRRDEMHLDNPPRAFSDQLDPTSRISQAQVRLELIVPSTQTRDQFRTLRLARRQALTVPSSRTDVPAEDVERDGAQRGEPCKGDERVVADGVDWARHARSVCPVARLIRIAQLGA